MRAQITLSIFLAAAATESPAEAGDLVSRILKPLKRALSGLRPAAKGDARFEQSAQTYDTGSLRRSSRGRADSLVQFAADRFWREHGTTEVRPNGDVVVESHFGVFMMGNTNIPGSVARHQQVAAAHVLRGLDAETLGAGLLSGAMGYLRARGAILLDRRGHPYWRPNDGAAARAALERAGVRVAQRDPSRLVVVLGDPSRSGAVANEMVKLAGILMDVVEYH